LGLLLGAALILFARPCFLAATPLRAMNRAGLFLSILISASLFSQISSGQSVVSSGGIYTVQGVFGPAQETALTGGVYGIDRGFFTLIVETAGAPTMKIQVQSADLVITWSGAANAFNLEQTSALGSPWTTVSASQQNANGDIKITIPLGAQNQFLRLKSANP
jgi:hypothetical protein